MHKATIIPRGRALGMVMQLPERDKLSMSREQMTSRLAIMMGGRVAEEMVFGREKVTCGAASDIEQATKLARLMVTRWGLSDKLGTVAYGENQDEVFLGYQVSRQQNISEATAQTIDAEVRKLVEAGYAEATQILTDKRADLEMLAKGLLEFETLTGDEIKDLINGKRPVREIGDRADHAALFRGAAGRQAAPAARRADRRSRAAAAGLSLSITCSERPPHGGRFVFGLPLERAPALARCLYDQAALKPHWTFAAFREGVDRDVAVDARAVRLRHGVRHRRGAEGLQPVRRAGDERDRVFRGRADHRRRCLAAASSTFASVSRDRRGHLRDLLALSVDRRGDAADAGQACRRRRSIRFCISWWSRPGCCRCATSATAATIPASSSAAPRPADVDLGGLDRARLLARLRRPTRTASVSTW